MYEEFVFTKCEVVRNIRVVSEKGKINFTASSCPKALDSSSQSMSYYFKILLVLHY